MSTFVKSGLFVSVYEAKLTGAIKLRTEKGYCFRFDCILCVSIEVFKIKQRNSWFGISRANEV